MIFIKNEFDVLVIRDHYPSENNPSSSPWVYDQVIGLQEMGYKPLVISPTPINPFKKYFKKKFRFYDSPCKEIESYKNTNVLRPPYLKIPNDYFIGVTLKNLTNCLLRYNHLTDIKIIHAHFGQNGFASLVLKKKLNVPLITSFYGYDSGRLSIRYKPFYKYLQREGDLFLALSKDMKKDLVSLGFNEEKILIHHLGVNLEVFRFNNKLINKFTILTVARLDQVKGIEYAINAVHLFLTKYPKIKSDFLYKIVGSGPHGDALKRLVNKLQMNESVVFIDNLSQKNSRDIVLKEMQDCDLFVLTSIKLKNGTKEGTPVVLMEAQSCGKPCITTFHAGIPEVVLNNKTGLLVQEKSSLDISKAIERLYFNRILLEKLGSNAREHINREFNQKIQMEKLGNIFKSLFD
ncbi:hypothetical protein APF79_03575 [bacterium BRH_c32]|nr:MAG: hypothetical protein APF79_03575 [bacterium BRH_c32]